MVGQPTRRRGFPGGLRAQLLLVLCVLVAAAFGLIAAFSLHVLRRQLHRAVVDSTQNQARLLARGVSDHHMAPADLGRQLVDTEKLTWAGVAGTDGVEGSGPMPPALAHRISAAAGRKRPAHFRVAWRGTPHEVALAPIGDGGRAAVAISSLAPINDELTATRRMLLFYLGLDALFILVIGYAFLTFLVVRPIRAIGVASERAARGDLASPITVLPKNEFGLVGHQFNQMLDELRRGREQLERRLEELDLANRQLRATQDSLIRSEKLASVGHLAAGVAHEVGNPLAAISGYLELLEEGDLDAETNRDMVQRSQREVERIRQIIRNLLDYSREDAEPILEPLALSQCVAEALELVRAQPKARAIAIANDLDKDLPSVEAVGSQVVQVLVNLLINAVDALQTDTPVDDGPRIDIDAQVSADEIVLRVRDNGPGICAEARSRVFDPFFTTKDPGEGTGLGLAICLRIMRRMGGDIRLESTPGEGSTFALVFARPRAN